MPKIDIPAKSIIGTILLFGSMSAHSAESYVKTEDNLSGELVSIGSDTLLGMMNRWNSENDRNFTTWY